MNISPGSEIKCLFYPLTSIEMASTLHQLDNRIGKFVPRRIDHMANVLNRFYQTHFSSEQVRILLENWESILPIHNDRFGGKSFEEIEREIDSYCSAQFEKYSVSLLNCFIPVVAYCLNRQCSKSDLSKPMPHHDVTVFCLDGCVRKGTMFFKLCSECNYKYFYNYYLRPDGQKMLTMHSDDDIFVVFSSYGYERRLLLQLDSDILFKHCGFSNFANAFNHTRSEMHQKDTFLMNRFHLQKTWFLWRLGNFCERENFRMPVPDQRDFHSMLLDLSPFIKELFTRKWGRKDYHKFCKDNCSVTLVLDGHQKATRRVCEVKNIHVPSVDGSIRDVKVGCSATPAFRSKKCQSHRDQENDDDTPQISNVSLPRKQRYSKRNRTVRRAPFSLRCKTLKSLQYKRILHRTSGIVAAAYNCGFICSLFELFGCESVTQVYNFLLYMHRNVDNFPNILIYDDACHLKLFIRNSTNFIHNTPAKQKIEQMKVFCDKLHYRNHIDPWCRKHTNPYTDPVVKDTNTEICEQIFAWLAQYKNVLRGCNESTFLIYLCLLCDLYNTNKFKTLQKEHLHSPT
jgi:hypothetical protein